MTSEKYFLKWVKEAGRGHIAAFLSWGCLAGYTLLMLARLRVSTEYHFFGIGSRELLWICMGLGAAFSLLEFSYLQQPKKLDFYYSLPVRKGTVFWSRYVHGLLHFMIPLCLAMTACGLSESSLDLDFRRYLAGYTGHSVLVFAAIFLIFYHMGILLISICGNILPVIPGYVLSLFYGHILVGNAFTAWAENYFRTYYRIPLFEKLQVILAPFSLAGQMSGSHLFNKMEVFEYVPSFLLTAAAFGWTVLSVLAFTAAQRKRKTERIGKMFVFPPAERVSEFLLSFLAGVWSGSFVTDVSGLAAEHPAAGGAVSILAGVFAASAVHFLMEWGAGSNVRKSSRKHTGMDGAAEQDHFTRQVISQEKAAMDIDIPAERERFAGQGIFRRKWQLAGECAAVILAGAVFLAGASSFDSYLPDENEVEKIGVSIDGLDMSNESYMQIPAKGYRYVTEQQLEKYLLAEEGKIAAQAWIASLAEKNNPALSGGEAYAAENGSLSDKDGIDTVSGMPSGYTHAAVCYHMKNGNEVYRLYPVYKEDLQAFASVYETDEYKRIAYPVAESRLVMEARISWSDGITDTVLKLTDEEKQALLDAYQKDIESMKMEKLGEALPLGFVEIDSEMRLFSGAAAVYPFFSQTCGLLEKYGVQIHKSLSDYSVRSVSVSRVSANGMGNPDVKYYEDPQEIEQWKQKAVPESFDLQPLLYPLDYSREIRAEINDDTTNSIINIYCYSMGE